MKRISWVGVLALAVVTAYAVGDLLDPDPVPVARAVELTGTAPIERPLPDGYFIVPPRVVDFREESDDDDSSDRSRPESEEAGSESAPLEQPGSGVGVDPDASTDDSPDEWDDEDDSVDDDD